MSNPTQDAGGPRPGIIFVNMLAVLIALVGVGGTLWLSMGKELRACPLCLYQRAFMMAAAGVFVIGIMTSMRGSALLHVLALPALIGGLGVAGFHVYLEMNGTLECPGGVMDVGSAPQQSLAAFGLLTLVSFTGLVQGCKAGECASAGSIASVILGAAFALGTIKSAPPLPTAPDAPYDPETQPLKGCRQPYHAE